MIVCFMLVHFSWYRMVKLSTNSFHDTYGHGCPTHKQAGQQYVVWVQIVSGNAYIFSRLDLERNSGAVERVRTTKRRGAGNVSRPHSSCGTGMISIGIMKALQLVDAFRLPRFFSISTSEPHTYLSSALYSTLSSAVY